jgi:hypothetical protein
VYGDQDKLLILGDSVFDTSEFLGWPSGDCKPALELVFTPNEIESKWNVHFVREKDDLDWYLGSHIKDTMIGVIVMMRHENSQSNGTVLYVDSEVDIIDAVKRIREVFGITQDDIAWEAPSN